MKVPTKESVPSLLLTHVPRELVVAVEESLIVGAQRAFAAARGMDDGHLPHVVGQMRHFHMNEAFQRALATSQASPTAIRGNGIVTGRAGIVTIGRFNVRDGLWESGRRSQTRKQMSLANKAIEPLVQPGLFDEYTPPTQVVAFFVACFAGSLTREPDAPTSVQIAIPDRQMRAWLFRERLGDFLHRYDGNRESQDDLAVPKLKKHVGTNKDVGGVA